VSVQVIEDMFDDDGISARASCVALPPPSLESFDAGDDSHGAAAAGADIDLKDALEAPDPEPAPDLIRGDGGMAFGRTAGRARAIHGRRAASELGGSMDAVSGDIFLGWLADAPGRSDSTCSVFRLWIPRRLLYPRPLGAPTFASNEVNTWSGRGMAQSMKIKPLGVK